MAYLLLEQIKIDGGTQSRVELNESVVADYADVIRRGDSLPPVVVFFDGSTHWLADGFHRFHAHRMAGAEAIEADVRTGARRDAVLYSVGANARHGLRRTNEDKRRAVQTLLDDEEWSQWSDRYIANACGVSHPFVASLRSGSCGTGNISSETPTDRKYITKHGSESVMNTENIGKREAPPADAAPQAAPCNPIAPPAHAAAVESISSEAPAPAAGSQVESESTVPTAVATADESGRSSVRKAPEALDQQARIAELEAELSAARANAVELAEMLESYDTVGEGEAAVAKELAQLKAHLRTVSATRDQWMTTCNELRREVKSLQRKLAKFEDAK